MLDELGAVRPTEWVWDTVSLILNTRYNDNRTTIITTNFDDEPAAGASGSLSPARAATRGETLGDRIGERMRSRLHEMCRIISLLFGYPIFRQKLYVESKLIGDKFISQACVVGDRRKHLAALIVPDYENLAEFLAKTSSTRKTRRRWRNRRR